MFMASSSENWHCSNERTIVMLTYIRVLRVTVRSDSGNGKYFKRRIFGYLIGTNGLLHQF